MCGRYTMTAPAEKVRRLFELGELPELEARYNIAPTQEVPIVRRGETGRELATAHWGLVPFWARDRKIASRLINARAETAAEKNAFRAAMRSRRCLLPATGFYEWRKTPDGKQPVYVQLADGELFALAGLWEGWEDPDGGALESTTILTTEANELLRDVHNRMPVILDPSDYAEWLDVEGRVPRDVRPLLAAFPSDRMRLTPVSRHVNSLRNDDVRCVEPLDPSR